MEIEKKFLLKGLPEKLESYHKKEIEQGYLSRKPVVRIRKSNDDYILTYKGKPKKSEESEYAICNVEIEADLTEESYYHLREKIDNHPISKTRYIIPIGTCADNCPGITEFADSKLKIELDMFHGILEGLVFAEIEFPSVEAARLFVKPDWFGEDVTNEAKYHNGHLSELDNLADL